MSSSSTYTITFGSGTGIATFSNGNAQTINKTGSVGNPVFTRLEVNKSANDLTLNTRINISSSLTLTQGIINTTSTNILNMNNNSSTTIGNAVSYINGPMNYDMATNSGSRRILNFPVGKLTDWRPTVLQVSHTTNTSYTYKAEVFNTNANALSWALPGTVDHVSYVHYWDIDRFNTSTLASAPNTDLRTTTGANPIITLQYNANDGVTDPSNLTICKNTSTATTTWIDIGGTGATVTSGNVSSTSSPSPFSSFSRFTLGNKIGGTNPLPIELLYFTATPIDNKTVQLDWATASEVNNHYFDIERSIDGVAFEHLTTVNAYGSGNSVTKQTYQATDEKPYKGISYYRLKQVDFSGDYKYANIVSVNITEKSFINFFPNPVQDKLMYSASDDFEMATIKILNTVGAVVLDQTQLNQFNGSIDLAGLANGVYYLRITNGETSQVIKINVQK